MTDGKCKQCGALLWKDHDYCFWCGDDAEEVWSFWKTLVVVLAILAVVMGLYSIVFPAVST